MSEANKRPHQPRNPLSIPETAPIRQLFPNFNPFYVPQSAPIRKVVPPSGSQAQNPLGANFHPFAVDKDAPISRLVRGGRPAASGTKITVDGKTYDTGYHSKEVAELRKKYPGGGNAAQSTNPLRPAQPEVTEPTAALSDTETIVNNNGMRQTGRNLTTIARGDGGSPYLEGAGGLFDNLGLGTGVTINRQWSSNQLPGTDTALYGGKPQSQQLGEGDQQVVLSQNLDEDGGAVRNLESMPLEAFQESQGVKADGIDSSQSEGGGSRNWMKPRELSAKEARRAAFLDAPNSMAGMRAVDAQLGRVRSGDSFYYANPDTSEGASEFIKVGLADGRAHQNDQLSGQDLLAKYTSGIKETMRAEEADTPSPAEFHPAMEIEQAGEVLNSYTQNGFHPDMEEEQFKAINY